MTADVEGARCCSTCHLGVKGHEFEFERNGKTVSLLIMQILLLKDCSLL